MNPPKTLQENSAIPSPPRLATLRKYGLNESDWVRFCQSCNCVCVICGKPFGNRPLAVDHEHVRGFKARKKKKAKNGKTIKVRVMPPEERKKHVRGVIHNFCNRFVRRWLTLERAESIVKYLRAFEASKQNR